MPEIKTNKNGYEIRTEVLGFAKEYVLSDFHAKFREWEIKQSRDSNGNLLTTVTMPEYPGIDTVLGAAQKMYDFVIGKNVRPEKED